MTELMRRRRALMTAQGGEKPWEDVSTSLSLSDAIAGTGIGIARSGGTTRVYTKSNGTYRSAYARNFYTSQGYEYKAECDMIYTSGTIRLTVANANNGTVYYSATKTSSGHMEFQFPHNDTITMFKWFVTWGTSETGDATFSNFKLYRRPTT